MPMTDAERFRRLMNAPRPFRKYFYCQIIFGIVLIYMWYQFNGGLVPWFLRRHIPVLTVGPDINPLYYFPDTENDGSNIKWCHRVNSKEALSKAMQGDCDMIEGDVILNGQDTDKQSLEPVMAEVPNTSSDLPFDAWLQAVAMTDGKGLKIDFQTIEAVEITLQKLKEMKNKLKKPVWLHADILQGPMGGKPRIDKSRYFRHVKRLFPECTFSLGWTTGTHTDLSLAGYSWDNVLDMYHLIKELELGPPLVISVRASLIKNSVPQIKWLTDNTRSYVLIWQSPEDRSVPQDLMYIAYRFAPEKSFFDVPNPELHDFLKKYRNKSKDKLHPNVLKRETVVFRPEAWLKMGLHAEEHSVLPSEEALVLSSRAVYVLTRAKFKPSSTISLNGRVQFLNRKNRDIVPGETGLNIYLRPTAYVDFDKIVAIRCFIGVDGQIKVTGSHLKVPDFTKSMRFTPGTSNCFRFSVVDSIDEVIVRLKVMHHCHTLDSVEPDTKYQAELRVPIPHDIGDEAHPFILKLEDGLRVAVFDELHIKSN